MAYRESIVDIKTGFDTVCLLIQSITALIANLHSELELI